jgi:hypothetical protein
VTIEYVLVMHDGSKATKFMSEDYCKDLMEQLAAAQSREVCTVAHENVETCGYCQRDMLTAENAALREERALIIQRAENAEAALVESDALLREMLAWKVAIECIAPELGGAIMTLARIDAHLAREEKP